jgi:putative Mg2+ transporter-C (MgtC) family protein
VSGLTTATTIWICAALGMAVGAGEYFIALVTTGVVVIVLSVFDKVQSLIEKLHHARVYRISFSPMHDVQAEVVGWLQRQKLTHKKKKLTKEKDQLTVVYEIYGSEKRLDEFSLFLQKEDRVMAFEF